MSNLADVDTAQLVEELRRRNKLPRCRCTRWQVYLGVWDNDGYTWRCFGCRKAMYSCHCR